MRQAHKKSKSIIRKTDSSVSCTDKYVTRWSEPSSVKIKRRGGTSEYSCSIAETNQLHVAMERMVA